MTDFKERRTRTNRNTSMVWFDLYEDWDLIESSFAMQYGIRLRNEIDMPWKEFVSLLSGLNQHTALGRMISIRSEEDKDVLKNFTKDQLRLRSSWRSKQALEMSEDEQKLKLFELQMALKEQFS